MHGVDKSGSATELRKIESASTERPQRTRSFAADAADSPRNAAHHSLHTSSRLADAQHLPASVSVDTMSIRGGGDGAASGVTPGPVGPPVVDELRRTEVRVDVWSPNRAPANRVACPWCAHGCVGTLVVYVGFGFRAAPRRCDKSVLRCSCRPGYVVQVNVANLAYCNNQITTSKYTLWSFVPRSLFEQFRRVANIYFLGISILMIIGTYAPSVFESPLLPFSTIGPLILVLAITMAKEGAEDIKRHRSDREVNNRKVSVLTPGGPDLETTWLELRVGQVIRVHNKHEVSACSPPPGHPLDLPWWLRRCPTFACMRSRVWLHCRQRRPTGGLQPAATALVHKYFRIWDLVWPTLAVGDVC